MKKNEGKDPALRHHHYNLGDNVQDYISQYRMNYSPKNNKVTIKYYLCY